MEFAKGLTKHTVLIIVPKQEKGVPLRAILTKLNLDVYVADSIYESMKIIEQHLPHLVLCSANVSDGTAGNVFDKLQTQEITKKTLMIAMLNAKTKEELQTVGNRKFHGYYIGAVQPKTFAAKVLEVLKVAQGASPFLVETEGTSLASEVMVSIPATALGKTEQQVVIKGTIEIDPKASVLAVPQDKKLPPAVLRMATNKTVGEEIFSMFPLNRVLGKGRSWVESLPEFDPESNKGPDTKVASQVLFFDPVESRATEFAEIFNGYNITLEVANALPRALSMLKQRAEGFTCIYLHELMNDAGGIAWKNAFNELPANRKPPLIVGTGAQNAKSTNEIKYITRPFGLGTFIELIRATCESNMNMTQAAEKTGFVGIPLSFQTPAELLGLDESGGIFRSKMPLYPGTKISFLHPAVISVVGDQAQVTVTGCGTDPTGQGFHIRFQALQAGMSKTKYWQKVALALTAQTQAKAS